MKPGMDDRTAFAFKTSFLCELLFAPVAVALLLAPVASAAESTSPPALALQNNWVQLQVGTNAAVRALSSVNDGRNLLSATNLAFMSLWTGTTWHSANSLTVVDHQTNKEMTLTFYGINVTAHATIAVHPDYLEVRTESLDGSDAPSLRLWQFVVLNLVLTNNVGAWLNAVSDSSTSVAVIPLDEKTAVLPAPTIIARGFSTFDFAGHGAAIVVCPPSQLQGLVKNVEAEQGLPSPTLSGQWAKTYPGVSKSWVLTTMAETNYVQAIAPAGVFATAADFGVSYVVIANSTWNTSFGHYPINTQYFPGGLSDLQQVANQAHTLGLKLGIHVMTRSVTKSDSYVTPVPDPRLLKDANATLAADVDALTNAVTAQQQLTGFGSAPGIGGDMDVQIDSEIIRYTGILNGAGSQGPYQLSGCVRGAYGTQPGPHAAGTPIQHLRCQYGWYLANTNLSYEIGANLARIINQAGLDGVCFDGEEAGSSDPTFCYLGHQVAKGILDQSRRDLLLTCDTCDFDDPFGWHFMSLGGFEDAMARGYKRWNDDYIVHTWAASHIANFLTPNISWVGIFAHTPTLLAARPDDIELVCARSLGYNAPVGWAFDVCAGGPSSLDGLNKNGRRAEIVNLINSYENMRLTNYFPASTVAPLQQLHSEWRLLAPQATNGSYQLVPCSYAKSTIIRTSAPETFAWQVTNSFRAQPLRVRIEALSALAAYGGASNVVAADFANASFAAQGNAASGTTFQLTGTNYPPAGAVARFSCTGPPSASAFPQPLPAGTPAWAQASASLPGLNLNNHRALGLWVCGDGGGEVLNIQLQVTAQQVLHFYQTIDFTGWKYCEIGEPEGDRVMDYFVYNKPALADLSLNSFTGITLMILNPPLGRNVELLLGRIEALAEIGGSLVNPQITVGGASLELPLTIQPEQYAETGDLWGARDPSICRLFDPNGQELSRVVLQPQPPATPAGQSAVQFSSSGQLVARAKVTVILLSSVPAGAPPPPTNLHGEKTN
jgi:hypothetical protein